MLPFGSIQQILNVFNHLYAILPSYWACSFLFLLCCQFHNWIVYLNGNVVTCRPVSLSTSEEVNNRCWEQMVSDCSARGALIRFLRVVEKVKGRAFLGDRLAELEGEEGIAFLHELTRFSNRSRQVHEWFEAVQEWKGTAFSHSRRLGVETETIRSLVNVLVDTYGKGGTALFRAWLEKAERSKKAAERLHPFLVEVEMGKIRALLRELQGVVAANGLEDLGYALWGELETGGPAALIQAVVDETERTRTRNGVQEGHHGQTCPFVLLPYQYLELAFFIMVLRVGVFRRFTRHIAVDFQAELEALTVRLKEAGKLDKAKMLEKLGEIADDFLYAVGRRGYGEGWRVGTVSMFDFFDMLVGLSLVETWGFTRLAFADMNVTYFFRLLSGHVPWNKVHFHMAGFPRFRKCTLGTMTATGVGKAVVSCELSLDAFNATMLSSFVWGHALYMMLCTARMIHFMLFERGSLHGQDLEYLMIRNIDDERYWRCSAVLAKHCDEADVRLLVSLLGRVSPVVSREFVYVLGDKMSQPDEGAAHWRGEVASSDRFLETSLLERSSVVLDRPVLYMYLVIVFCQLVLVPVLKLSNLSVSSSLEQAVSLVFCISSSQFVRFCFGRFVGSWLRSLTKRLKSFIKRVLFGAAVSETSEG